MLSSQVASSFFSLMRGSSCPSGVGDAEEREREREWLWEPVDVGGLGGPTFFYFPTWPD